MRFTQSCARPIDQYRCRSWIRPVLGVTRYQNCFVPYAARKSDQPEHTEYGARAQ